MEAAAPAPDGMTTVGDATAPESPLPASDQPDEATPMSESQPTSPRRALSIHRASFAVRTHSRSGSPIPGTTPERQPSSKERPSPSASPVPPPAPSLRTKAALTLVTSSRAPNSRMRDSISSRQPAYTAPVPVHTVELSFGAGSALTVGMAGATGMSAMRALSSHGSRHLAAGPSSNGSMHLSASRHFSPRSTYEDFGFPEGGDRPLSLGSLGSTRARALSSSRAGSRHNSRSPSRVTSRTGQAAFGGLSPQGSRSNIARQEEEAEEDGEEEEGEEFDALQRLMLGCGPSSRMELTGCLLLQLELMASELYEGDLGAPSRPGTPEEGYGLEGGQDPLLAALGMGFMSGEESWDGSSTELDLGSENETTGAMSFGRQLSRLGSLRQVQTELEVGGDVELRQSDGGSSPRSMLSPRSRLSRDTSLPQVPSRLPSRSPSRRLGAESPLNLDISLTSHAAAFARLEDELAQRRAQEDARAAAQAETPRKEQWKRPATFQQPAMPLFDNHTHGWMAGEGQAHSRSSPRNHHSHSAQSSPRSGAGTPRHRPGTEGDVASAPIPFTRQARGGPSLLVGDGTAGARSSAAQPLLSPRSQPPLSPCSPRAQQHPHPTQQSHQAQHAHQLHHHQRPTAQHTAGVGPRGLHSSREGSHEVHMHAQRVCHSARSAEDAGNLWLPDSGTCQPAVTMPSAPAQLMHSQPQPGQQARQLPPQQQHLAPDRLHTAPAAMQSGGLWEAVRPSSVAGLSATLQGGLGRTRRTDAVHAMQLRSSCAIYKGPRPGVSLTGSCMHACCAPLHMSALLLCFPWHG